MIAEIIIKEIEVLSEEIKSLTGNDDSDFSETINNKLVLLTKKAQKTKLLEILAKYEKEKSEIIESENVISINKNKK